MISRLARLPKVWWGIAALVSVTAYYVLIQDYYNVYVFNRVLLACIGALALNVLMGTAGQVSLGNAAFLLVGAFSAVVFLRADVPFPLDVILAALFTGLIGLIAGLPALRLKSLFLALSTLSLHFIANFLANRYQASVPESASSGFRVKTLFASKGLLGGQHYWAWLLCLIVVLLLLAASRITRYRTGRAWRMIRDHELVAATFGIAVVRYKLGVFVGTSMAVGLAGAVTAHFTGSVQTDGYTLLLAIQFVAMILIGGLDSVLGAVVGATIVTALPQYVPSWVASVGFIGKNTAAVYGPQISQIIYGVLLIIFITASPEGIAGWLRNLRNRITSALGRGARDTARRGVER